MRTPLEKSLRSALERTTLAGRETAESAARDILEHLGVTLAKAPDWLDAGQAALRRALRARARALGGELAADGTQKVAALVEEIAYEQWNRMVFARFLAENGLLMYDGVAVTLDDCAALAEELGLGSAWDVAADSAAKMLPNVFRTDSLSFRIAFAPDKVNRLKELVEGLDPATFQASDALGWIYQYWQTKKKASVNASEVKIGADELAPVTQLFTEPYMVAFLLDNTLGAWYAAPKLKGRTFATEAEARAAVATPELPLAYLRLVPSCDRTSGTPGTSGTDGRAVAPRPPCEWQPAAGTFDKWPASLADFSMLDPCCGSGHFAVAALLMLVPMRMELEGLDARTAVERVLAENIHALELDRRCVEIAVFAVALEAWRYPNAGGYRKLPKLHIACDGIAPKTPKEEWLRLARRAARASDGGRGATALPPRDRDRMVGSARRADRADDNDDAPVGSAPRADRADEPESLYEAQLVRSMGELWDCFQQAPILGSLISPDLFASDLFHADYATLADVLAEHFDKSTAEEREAALAAQGIIEAIQLLGRKYTLVATNVPYLARGKQDAELQKFCLEFYEDAKGDLATVFLDRCRKFLDEGTVTIVLPQNWMFQPNYRKFRLRFIEETQLNYIARLGEGGFESGAAAGAFVGLVGFGINQKEKSPYWYIDVGELDTPSKKDKCLKEKQGFWLLQRDHLKAKDAIVGKLNEESCQLLDKRAASVEGLTTGDMEQFVRKHWELCSYVEWRPFIQNVDSNVPWGGRTDYVLWNDQDQRLKHFPTAHNFPPSRIDGIKVLQNVGVRITQMREPKITFFGGEIFGKSGATVVLRDNAMLPALYCYILTREFATNVDALNPGICKPVGTYVKVPFDLPRWQKVAAEKYPNGLPKPFTDDPTQWIFHGHPCGSVVWDETAKRLKIGPDRVDATVLHVAVARLMGYKWPSELDDKMELADEMRAVMARNAALENFVDDDGIVCIPALNGEEGAAARVTAMLEAAYGAAWSAQTLEKLLAAVGAEGKTLEEWLRKDLFLQHAKLFGNRPFIWQIWDGLRDGFSVLVNYHKLDRKGLETLIYSYLGDWITRQNQDVAQGVPGADEKLDRAQELKGKLEKILEGEAPYDIFVRWKPLAEQPVGWNPDLNDGVRLNIRPFCEAGVLREKAQKLNLKWAKDRGKDVASAPWYEVFKGDRINDHHTTLAEKAAAR